MPQKSKSILCIMLTFLFAVQVNGLTKEQLFKVIRKEVRSRIVTDEFIRNPSTKPKFRLGNYYELEADSGRFNSYNTVSNVLLNSYKTNIGRCGDTAGGNNVLFFFTKLDGIHKYYNAKHFCGVFGTGCKSVPDQSIMVTHDKMEFETIKDDCSGLAQLFKDYEAFADTTFKMMYEYAKKQIVTTHGKQKELQSTMQKAGPEQNDKTLNYKPLSEKQSGGSICTGISKKELSTEDVKGCFTKDTLFKATLDYAQTKNMNSLSWYRKVFCFHKFNRGEITLKDKTCSGKFKRVKLDDPESHGSRYAMQDAIYLLLVNSYSFDETDVQWRHPAYGKMVILRDLTQSVVMLTNAHNNKREIEKQLTNIQKKLTRYQKQPKASEVYAKLIPFVEDYNRFAGQYLTEKSEKEKLAASKLAQEKKKKETEKKRKRKEYVKRIKSGQLPIKSIDDATLYYGAKNRLDGFNIVLQTPLQPDNKYYVVGGAIKQVTSAKNGQMLYSAQAGKDKVNRFHFMFFSKETEANAKLRRNHYTEFVGKFIKVNSKGEPVFMMYFCD